MSALVTATGTHPGNAPTLLITGGRGNTDDAGRQIHLAFRDSGADSEKVMQAWFNVDAILDAITDATPTTPTPGASA
ncbi:hypothetical protein BKA24_001737 [Microbacterium marinum]|uniref:Uncharacterized protein n=1 Tax=Microbacterium marinum TaxID=421115 RepID=A0A7W7FJC9_9MICO|nr:hypothetical protein [Microbacterium marinum]MBB4667028.1 hypothetical protein [Microbacterium marinum]